MQVPSSSTVQDPASCRVMIVSACPCCLLELTHVQCYTAHRKRLWKPQILPIFGYSTLPFSATVESVKSTSLFLETMLMNFVIWGAEEKMREKGKQFLLYRRIESAWVAPSIRAAKSCVEGHVFEMHTGHLIATQKPISGQATCKQQI